MPDIVNDGLTSTAGFNETFMSKSVFNNNMNKHDQVMTPQRLGQTTTNGFYNINTVEKSTMFGNTAYAGSYHERKLISQSLIFIFQLIISYWINLCQRQ